MGSTVKPDVIELVLSCGSWQDAQAIADLLLGKSLVAHVEFFDTLEISKEVKLVMQSLSHNLQKIEAELAKLYGFRTFVLQLVPLHQSVVGADRYTEVANG